MPMPRAYQRAAADFDAFLEDAREALGLATRHQTYTVIEGVFLTFRRRLRSDEVLVFATALPPLLRALFIADWTPDAPVTGFGDRDSLAREVQSLRRHHNFAPDDAIARVAGALRRHVGADALDAALARLPPPATAYWEAS